MDLILAEVDRFASMLSLEGLTERERSRPPPARPSGTSSIHRPPSASAAASRAWSRSSTSRRSPTPHPCRRSTRPPIRWPTSSIPRCSPTTRRSSPPKRRRPGRTSGGRPQGHPHRHLGGDARRHALHQGRDLGILHDPVRRRGSDRGWRHPAPLPRGRHLRAAAGLRRHLGNDRNRPQAMGRRFLISHHPVRSVPWHSSTWPIPPAAKSGAG